MLTLLCPFCRHENADDFEFLDVGNADTIRCENPDCNKRFAYLVRECLACGEESAFTWGGIPAPEALAALLCKHCGAPLDEAPQERETEDTAQRVQ